MCGGSHALAARAAAGAPPAGEGWPGRGDPRCWVLLRQVLCFGWRKEGRSVLTGTLMADSPPGTGEGER